MTSDLPDFRKHYTWRSYSAPFYFPFFNSYVEVCLFFTEDAVYLFIFYFFEKDKSEIEVLIKI